MSIDSLHEALVTKLRASGVAGIEWGNNDSPFYQVVPDHPERDGVTALLKPYVVLDIPESTTEHNFDGGYTEMYRGVTVSVIAQQAAIMGLASPTASGSVFHYLDEFHKSPEVLNGDGYECIEFLRTGWALEVETGMRAPDGGRVMVATAKYDIDTTVNYH